MHEICGFALKLVRCYNDQDDLPAYVYTEKDAGTMHGR